jgi:small ligand-binding sensory domain FIST
MFQSAHAQGTDWQSALDDCLHELADNPGATLGFVYVTDAIAPYLAAILEVLKTDTGIEKWVGSAGLGVCALGGSGGHEYFDVPAIAVMTAVLPVDDFDILPTIDAVDLEEYESDPVNDNFLTGPPLVLLHADCANEEVLEIIDDIAIESEGFLIGGLTLSDTPKHHVANEVTGGGVSGIIFNPEVGVTTALSQGCRPIGKVHEVTESAENFVIGLDGRSAVEVFKEDIGEVLARDLEKVGGFIHAALPVVGSDTGDYVVRNLIGVDLEEGVIAIAAPVEHGDHLMFVSRDANAAQKDLAEMVAGLKKRSGSDVKGGIYISCIARGPNMFGEANAEMQIIESVLGDVPIIGLYANGEISNNRLYSYTGVLTLFT